MKLVRIVVAVGLIVWTAWLCFTPGSAGLTGPGIRAVGVESDMGAMETPLDAGIAHAPEEGMRVEATVAVEPADELNLPEPASGAVTGHVVDPDGSPVANGQVYIGYRSDWIKVALDTAPEKRAEKVRPRWETTTDVDGRFSYRGLDPGDARLRVLAGGFEPLDVDGIEISESGKVDLGELVLNPGIVLEGRVVDGAGEGVAGAVLSRMDEGKGFFNRGDSYADLGTTDSDGRFRVDTLKPGSWCIRVESEDHPSAWFEGRAYEVGLSSGHEVRLAEAASIGGWLAIPGVTDYSRYGVFLKRVDIKADALDENRRGESQWVECAPDGRFDARRLVAPEPSTLYWAEARDVAGGSLSVAGDRMEFRTGEHDVRLTAEAPAVVAFELSDGAGPIEEPVVHFARINGGSVNLTERGWVRKVGAGRFRVEGLPRPSQLDGFALRIQVDGFRDYFRGNLGLAPGEERELGVIELQQTGFLGVRAIDRDSRAPITGAEVRRYVGSPRSYKQLLSASDEFQLDDKLATAITGEDGVAVVPVSTEQESYVVVDHPEYAPTVSEAVEARGTGAEQQVLDIELRRGARIRVRLQTDRGVPVSGVRVSCNAVTWASRIKHLRDWSVRSATGAETDSDGVVVFEHQPLGETKVQFRPKIGEVQSRSLELVDDVEYELVLDVPEFAVFDMIVREAGNPLVEAQLTLTEARLAAERQPGSFTFSMGGMRSTSASTETDVHGRGHFESVEPGWYELVVSHPSRAFDTAREIQILPGVRTVEVDLEVSMTSGRVVDPDGTPRAGTPVYAIPSEGPYAGTLEEVVFNSQLRFVYPEEHGQFLETGDGGEFRFRGLSAGASYRIVALPSGSQVLQTEPFTVDGGANLELPDLVASIAGRLEVTIGGFTEPCAVELTLVEGAETLVPKQMVYAFEASRVVDHLAPGTWLARLVEGNPDPAGIRTRYLDEGTVVVRAGELAKLGLDYAP